MPPSERTITAYHEAGHALVGYLAFGNPGRTSIRPTAHVLGVQVTERLVATPATIAAALAAPATPTTRAYWIAQAHAGCRHALAGRVAEGVLLGRPRPILQDDDGLEACAYHDAAYGPDVLMRGAMLHRERIRVGRWLRAHWRHARAVARALRAHEEITGDELLALLARLPPLRRPLYAEDRVVLRAAKNV